MRSITIFPTKQYCVNQIWIYQNRTIMTNKRTKIIVIVNI